MLYLSWGDILESRSEALVNPVNTVGVMGAGLALQFKLKFPASYHHYRKLYGEKKLEVGKVTYFDYGGGHMPRWIIHFPTKEHWSDPSMLSYIETGLDDLVKLIEEVKIRSISIPALGCGLGQLSWDEVEPLIKEKIGNLKGVEVFLYKPQ